MPLPLPSPPPIGWSTGFITVPRTVGRNPFHRTRPGEVPPGMEIALVTDDVAAAFEKAVAAGALPLMPPKEKPWGQVVGYVRDLNGALVELCSPMG